MANILGIDQSYTSCALCIVNDAGVLSSFTRFKSDAEKDIFERALEVAQFITTFVTEYKPDAVKIEGLAFGISGNATRDLAGLLFTIVNVMKLKHPEMKLSVVAPTQVKKRATGSGKAKKEEMIASLPDEVRQTFIDAKFKKTTGLSDLSDAYWIART